jgi:TPP-dependent pyruvate/acetoin dehydrogenase alpha subunit
MSDDFLRFIGNGAEIPDRDAPSGLADKDLVELFRWLVHLRIFDERAVSLQRQGRIGTYPLYWGEEATQAGALYACEETDWVFPTYRQLAVGILRGVPIATILGWCRGYASCPPSTVRRHVTSVKWAELTASSGHSRVYPQCLSSTSG